MFQHGFLESSPVMRCLFLGCQLLFLLVGCLSSYTSVAMYVQDPKSCWAIYIALSGRMNNHLGIRISSMTFHLENFQDTEYCRNKYKRCWTLFLTTLLSLYDE